MSRSGPSKRGYHNVMVADQDYEKLTAYRDTHNLSSPASAIRKLLDTPEGKAPSWSRDDVEQLISFAAITGRSAQKVRDWFGV